MKEILNKIINTGVKPDYQFWETSVTRKLNSITLIAFLNMILGIVFFEIVGYTEFMFECAVALFLFPFVFVLNKYKNYIWAAYLYFGLGFLWFIPMNLKMGKESYLILFYFPIIISMVQLMGRRETFKHLVILSLFCLLSISAVAIGFKFQLLQIELGDNVKSALALFNSLLCFFITLFFTLTMASESIRQETLIMKVLKEKEILLAEVFHRVKNNMNIITSLLNLKKNLSDSSEVQNALEECRGRVFSMALVHNSIFSSNNNIGLDFKKYVENLISEIANSLGDKEIVDINMDTDDFILELSNAVPCGLILNELLTNAFKYGKSENKKLQIQVKLKKRGDIVEIEVKDNGPGLPKDIETNTNTLGLELIKSLSEQISGTYSFSNNSGMIFNLKFKQAA